jgi:hypothetical protein
MSQGFYTLSAPMHNRRGFSLLETRQLLVSVCDEKRRLHLQGSGHWSRRWPSLRETFVKVGISIPMCARVTLRQQRATF